jgi:inner membrane protein
MNDAATAGLAGAAPTKPETSKPAGGPGRFSSGRFLANLFSGVLARCALIGLITLLLLVPLGMVKGVVYERTYLHRQATGNITGTWGEAQTVSGPALVIPYQTWQDRKEIVKTVLKGKQVDKEVTTREYLSRYMVVLPSELAFEARVDPEIRYRGIYRQALYNAPVSISGAFTLPVRKDFGPNMHQIFWDKAWLSVGVTDLKTISEETPAAWNGAALPAYKPGADTAGLLGPGFHTAVALSEKDAGMKRAMALRLKIRGSGGIAFTPVGEKTRITINGTWPDPSFQGNLLPKERSIGKDGFSATWDISNLTRTYPQIADLENSAFRTGGRGHDGSAVTAFTAGVDLHEQVSLYRMVRRSLDYGILFIAVSFVALFSFEMLTGRRMHLVQYAMVGLSMSLFYLVLLSLAEHIDFGRAFAAASAVTVVMNSLYVGAALHSRLKGGIMAGLFASLYGVLFSLLRMEDFALLMGTALVLVMMGVLMFVTRKLPRAHSL